MRRPAGSVGSDPTLGALELVVVEHARVTLTDEVSHLSVEGEIADLELRRRDGGGITGGANGRFTVGGASVALAMTAALLPDGGTHYLLSINLHGSSARYSSLIQKYP